MFTNPVGVDDDQVRNGNAMVLDPYGEVIAECTVLGDDVTVGLCTGDKIEAGVREKLRYSDVPHGLRGLGITFMTVGLMAMAFMAFSGIQL